VGFTGPLLIINDAFVLFLVRNHFKQYQLDNVVQ